MARTDQHVDDLSCTFIGDASKIERIAIARTAMLGTMLAEAGFEIAKKATWTASCEAAGKRISERLGSLGSILTDPEGKAQRDLGVAAAAGNRNKAAELIWARARGTAGHVKKHGQAANRRGASAPNFHGIAIHPAAGYGTQAWGISASLAREFRRQACDAQGGLPRGGCAIAFLLLAGRRDKCADPGILARTVVVEGWIDTWYSLGREDQDIVRKMRI
jgi:hypothetical protein